MGARNVVGIGLLYRPARVYWLAELVPWNRFLGSIKVKKLGSEFGLEKTMTKNEYIRTSTIKETKKNQYIRPSTIKGTSKNEFVCS
jgi:hypothetical protein